MLTTTHRAPKTFHFDEVDMTKKRIAPVKIRRAQDEIRDLAECHGLAPKNFVRFRQLGSEYLIGVYRIERGRTISITVPIPDEGE